MTDTSASESNSTSAPDKSEDRRWFVKILSVVIGGIVTIVPAVIGTIFFFDPLLRKKRNTTGGRGEHSPGEGFVKVTSTDSIPTNGVPVFQRVSMDVVDAWNVYKDQPIGSVFLRKTEAGEVSCFNTECPHLGCAVDYNGSTQAFRCPCHDSEFSLTGERRNEIPPRDLDQLEAKVDENGDVWVRFQSFKNGIPEQIPKS